jgi:hypothetical protein
MGNLCTSMWGNVHILFILHCMLVHGSSTSIVHRFCES